MKRISTYIVTLVLALAGSSCSDYLDKEYDASLSEKKVFNNQNLTREFLANIYTNLPDGLAPLSDDQFTGASRDCMTDNAVTCWGLHYYTKIGSDVRPGEKHQISFINERGTVHLSVRVSEMTLQEKHVRIIAINDINSELSYLLIPA